VFSFPAALIAEVDQSKAYADSVCSAMLNELAEDLERGNDPAHLWYGYTYALTNEHPYKVAAVLTSALLRLAERDMEVQGKEAA
jgi:hypothetical protein